PDPKYLFPDGAATLEAARQLVAEGFVVLPYIHADPTLAKNLEDVGCATVMPLGSAIGSGQGIHTTEEIKIIIEQAKVPVIVDAGLAVPSDASHALELGASAVLVNTAIAQAENPALMGEAFKHGVEAGRKAYLSGRIGVRHYAAASSPTADVPQPVQARS
ncbi:MAG: thiazole synthase, partial [Chloroflexi bacterium]|nr:thiazole synthase [Chloroflexota bacterium]